jgi:hypothetical protein
MKKLVYLFLSIAMLAFIFGNSLLEPAPRARAPFCHGSGAEGSDWLALR